MRYRHRQTSYVILASAVAIMVLVGMIVAAAGSAGAALVVAGIVVLLLVVGVLFSDLTVTLTDTEVTACFRWGWPKRVTDLSDVVAVRQVRNHWYHGWGIRKVSRGWMYNVAGLDAVELELRSGKVFRIGTDEPGPLEEALTAAL